jgi:hypothetical protein
MIQDWEPWVKEIIRMRNAVDHPEDKKGGKLVVHNFRLAAPPQELSVIEPMWGLSDGPTGPAIDPRLILHPRTVAQLPLSSRRTDRYEHSIEKAMLRCMCGLTALPPCLYERPFNSSLNCLPFSL